MLRDDGGGGLEVAAPARLISVRSVPSRELVAPAVPITRLIGGASAGYRWLGDHSPALLNTSHQLNRLEVVLLDGNSPTELWPSWLSVAQHNEVTTTEIISPTDRATRSQIANLALREGLRPSFLYGETTARTTQLGWLVTHSTGAIETAADKPENFEDTVITHGMALTLVREAVLRIENDYLSYPGIASGAPIDHRPSKLIEMYRLIQERRRDRQTYNDFMKVLAGTMVATAARLAAWNEAPLHFVSKTRIPGLPAPVSVSELGTTSLPGTVPRPQVRTRGEDHKADPRIRRARR